MATAAEGVQLYFETYSLRNSDWNYAKKILVSLDLKLTQASFKHTD